MPADTEFVTVFRSADESAAEDAAAVRELLTAQGLNAILLDDNAPDVPEMAYEVRVPPEEAARAEELINQASLPTDELTNVDDSPELDLETVFRSASGDMEALAVQSVLEDAGIGTVIVGDPVLPNLPFEVRVAKEHVERARALILEAQAAGPQAAEEAEAASESPLNP